VRMCLGCGERAPQPTLVRIAVGADGLLRPVLGEPQIGRTGYLHPAPTCWERFAARKGPVRSLGRSIDRLARQTLLETLRKLDQGARMR